MNEDIGFGAVVSLRDKFSSVAQRVERSARSLEKTMGVSAKTVTSSIKGMTVGLALMGGAGLAGMAFSPIIKAAAEFEKTMNRVEAISGASGQALATLSDQARDLGARTAFSASQAAEGMSYLALAGFQVNEITAAMPAVLQTAVAGQLDLASAADITAQILRGYGIQASDAARVSDVLAKAFTTANTDLRSLGEGFKHAGPVANAAGIQFEEAAATLALMADAGFQGSIGGTSLRNAIVDMMNPLGAGIKVVERLGIQMRDSSGAIIGMAELLDQLESSGATAEDMMQLFGARGGPAMIAVAERGADALRKMTAALEQSGGTAARIERIQLKGLDGAMIEFRSALEGVRIEAGQTGGMLALLESIARRLTGALSWLRETMAAYPTATRAFGTVAIGSVILVGLAGAALFAVSAFRLIAAVTPWMIGRMATAFVGLLPMVWPFLAVATAVGVAVATMTSGENRMVDSLKSLWNSGKLIATGLVEIWQTMTGNTARLSGETAAALEKAGLLGFVLKTAAVMARARALFRGFFEGFGQGFRAMGDAIASVLPQGSAARQMIESLTDSIAGMSFGSTIEDWARWGRVIGYVGAFLAIAATAIKAVAIGTKLAAIGFAVLTSPITWLIAAFGYLIARWDTFTQAFKVGGLTAQIKVLLSDVLSLVIMLSEQIQRIPGVGKALVPDIGLAATRQLRDRLMAEATGGAPVQATAPVQAVPNPAVRPMSPASIEAMLGDIKTDVPIVLELDGRVVAETVARHERSLAIRGAF